MVHEKSLRCTAPKNRYNLHIIYTNKIYYGVLLIVWTVGIHRQLHTRSSLTAQMRGSGQRHRAAGELQAASSSLFARNFLVLTEALTLLYSCREVYASSAERNPHATN